MDLKPKPEHLIVKTSPWYGLTVKTSIPIKKGTLIACTDKNNYDSVDCHINTPYGALFNSTDDYRDVNCKRIIDDDFVKIFAAIDIEPGDELLCPY